MSAVPVPTVLKKVAILRPHPERGDLSMAEYPRRSIHLPYGHRFRKTVHGLDVRLRREPSPRRRGCWHEVLPPLPPERRRRRAILSALLRPLAHQGTSLPLPLRPAPP